VQNRVLERATPADSTSALPHNFSPTPMPAFRVNCERPATKFDLSANSGETRGLRGKA